MNISVKSAKKAEEKIKFPCLMQLIDASFVVLFKSEDEGVIIVPDDNHYVGDHSVMWDIEKFQPFEGEITLSND